MVLQSESPTHTLELKQYRPDPFSQHAPVSPATPSEWFSRKFPHQAKVFGCPFMEQKERVAGAVTKITPITMNHDFHAAILGGDNSIGPRVIYFPADLQFYFQDADQIFKPTTEEKLQNLFRAYLMRCAEELPDTVNKLPLVVDFRNDTNVKTVIKRAKAILAADHTFFSVDSPHQRQKGPELEERMARIFVQHALEREPNTILTLTDAYSTYVEFLKRKDVSAPRRETFKGLIAPVIRDEFDLGLRKDLPGPTTKNTTGWKGLKTMPVTISHPQ